jgi:hypothetical protein
MQLKYNRQQKIGSTIIKALMKLALVFIIGVAAVFLIEKINFPSPKENYKIDISNEVIKLK